jgi:hypothetical protein
MIIEKSTYYISLTPGQYFDTMMKMAHIPPYSIPEKFDIKNIVYDYGKIEKSFFKYPIDDSIFIKPSDFFKEPVSDSLKNYVTELSEKQEKENIAKARSVLLDITLPDLKFGSVVMQATLLAHAVKQFNQTVPAGGRRFSFHGKIGKFSGLFWGLEMRGSKVFSQVTLDTPEQVYANIPISLPSLVTKMNGNKTINKARGTIEAISFERIYVLDNTGIEFPIHTTS